jgi:hypothetical protein
MPAKKHAASNAMGDIALDVTSRFAIQMKKARKGRRHRGRLQCKKPCGTPYLRDGDWRTHASIVHD